MAVARVRSTSNPEVEQTWVATEQAGLPDEWRGGGSPLAGTGDRYIPGEVHVESTIVGALGSKWELVELASSTNMCEPCFTKVGAKGLVPSVIGPAYPGAWDIRTSGSWSVRRICEDVLADLDFSLASTYRISGTFGLLCSARLAVVAERAGTPVREGMRQLISSMGGLGGDFEARHLSVIQQFIDDVPVLDDPKSPVYFTCTAAMIAVESLTDRSDPPERLAWRLSCNAMNAWSSCDRILRREPELANRLCDEMGQTLGEYEEERQREVLHGLTCASDTEEFYSRALGLREAGRPRMESIAAALARIGDW